MPLYVTECFFVSHGVCLLVISKCGVVVGHAYIGTATKVALEHSSGYLAQRCLDSTVRYLFMSRKSK